MPDERRRLRVLFLCTGNACRSQMAEGWARALKGDVLEPYSAGVSAQELDPLAVRVMAEEGVDISAHRAKRVEELDDVRFDYVVTVCDNAREACPVFPAAPHMVHQSFDDPPALIANKTMDDKILPPYRRVRDEIRAFVEKLPATLKTLEG